MRSIGIIIVFFTFSVLAAEPKSAATYEPPSQSANTNQKSQTHASGTEQSPFIIKILPAPHTKEEAAYEAYEQNEKPTIERRTFYVTTALVLITLALAIFTAGLWHATYKLAKDAKSTADRQAMETSQSLLLARQSAQAAIRSADAALAGQRAHLFPARELKGSLIAPHGQNSFWVTHLAFVNHGHTSALLEARGGRIIFSDALPPEQVFTPDDTDWDIGQITIQPKGFAQGKSINFPLTDADLADVKLGTKQLYLFAFIVYTDVFNTTWKRRFCLRYDVPGGAFTTSGCRKYNYETLESSDTSLS